MFATQHLFHRVGRALIKPVYAQKGSRNGIIGPRLRAALEWWLRVLCMSISETREWKAVESRPCHLFVDAASSPARCAAILFHSGGISYTDAAPNDAMWSLFCQRRDKQITGLEICAIALGLSTFQQQIAGRTVFLYSDNTGLAFVCRRVWLLMACWVLCVQALSAAPPKALPRHLITTLSFIACGCKL